VAAQAEEAEAIKEAASAGLALARAVGALKGLRGDDPGATSQVVTALRGIYRTPWEVVLQRWMESVAPGERTFVRASRRGADRSDLVLPGRRREGWMLNVIVDTSGSMAEEIPRALGAIADFCDSVAVDQIRLLQCDVTITSDELLSPMELAQYRVTGYGGSDLTPAMELLAADPQVRAAAIITDGDVQLPADPMPYAVLWVLPPGRSAAFRPSYGRVVIMDSQSSREA
jgi:predicted metal-dependent peptidase